MKKKPVGELLPWDNDEEKQKEVWPPYGTSHSAAELAAIAAPFVAAGKTQTEGLEMAWELVFEAADWLHLRWYNTNMNPPPGTRYSRRRSGGGILRLRSLESANREVGYKPSKDFKSFRGALERGLADDPDEYERLTNTEAWKDALAGQPMFSQDVIAAVRSANQRMRSARALKAAKGRWPDRSEEPKKIKKNEAPKKGGDSAT